MPTIHDDVTAESFTLIDVIRCQIPPSQRTKKLPDRLPTPSSEDPRLDGCRTPTAQGLPLSAGQNAPRAPSPIQVGILLSANSPKLNIWARHF